MKNVKQLLEKEQELTIESLFNKNYIRSYSHSRDGAFISKSFLGEEDEEPVKNLVWIRFLRNPEDSKRFKQLQDFINNNLAIISRALTFIQKSMEEDTEFLGNSYYVGTIGKLSYEFFEE
jgi:hypothetical protein